MSKRTWIIFAAVVVVLFGGLVYFSGQNRVDVSNVNGATVQQKSDTNGQIGDHVFGKADSKVVFVEYGDFQCPGCGSAFQRVKTITEKYEGQIAFVFRNFPITSIHPNARVAAAAAEAAGLQGKYFELHDLLYQNQSAWENLGASERTDYFLSLASQLSLDTTKFKTDLSNEAITKKINFDMALAKKANVDSTPSFFLNGTTLAQEVWSDDTKLEEAIVAEIKRQGIELPAQKAE